MSRPDVSHHIDQLLDSPCWVIDVLPSQVPAGNGGQFFDIEPLLLGNLRERFARMLLKLNCYHDFLVVRGERSKGRLNPKPQKLQKWLMRNDESLCILLPHDEALIFVPTESTYMALHSPSRELLEQAKLLASSEGLFVWRPQDEEGGNL